MYHDTRCNQPGIGAVLVAAVAAVQVLAFAFVAVPDTAPGRESQATAPVLPPEVVATAPRIGS